MQQIEPGQTLGRYRILRRLGAGAMGEVFLAEDPQIDRRLAIKTVLVGEGSVQELAALKDRLLREAKAAGRLIHPHVVTLFDAGEVDGVFYLAFEYVAGQDLQKRKGSDPPLTLGQVLRLVREAAAGLAAAHAQGVIHRDIKPSNLLLDEAGTLKIADFGIAKRIGEGTELTLTGTVVGSPHYLSPEQVRGEGLDARSDLFSLGVVLYELLTHRRPFEAEALTTLVYRILNEEARPVGELRPGLPPRLEGLVRRLLAKDPGDRIQTAGELVQEIQTLEAELPPAALATTAALAVDELEETRELPRTGAPPLPPPLSPTGPGRREQASRGGRWRLVMGTGLGVVVVVSLAVAGWWLLRPEPTRVEGRATAVPGSQTEVPPAVAQEKAGPVAAAEVVGGPPGEDEPREEPPAQGDGTRTATATGSPVEIRGGPPGVSGGEPGGRAPEPSPASSPGAAEERPTTSGRDAVAAPAPPLPRERAISTAPRPASQPPPAEPEAEPVPVVEAASPEPPSVDRTLESGPQIRFVVDPPDTFVQLRSADEDRYLSLGQAQQWDPSAENGRLYTLPGPGVHYLRLRKSGMEDQLICLQVRSSGPPATLTARMRPLAARELDLGDLEVVRVAESVAIRVKPPEAASAARVLLDGEVVGGAGREAWLRLPVGRHRLSVESPGYRRYDLVVEILPGADDRRKRVDVVLTRER